MVGKLILMSCFTLALLMTSAAKAITAGQKDDFENGTTQGWISGSQNTHPPVNVSSGGPVGAGDHYLQITSSGGFGQGSKLVAFNQNQWTGNYTAADIAAISADVRNFGNTNLTLRLALRGPSGYIYSITGVSLAGGSDWQTVVFPVNAADMTGSANVSTTLANVTELRLLHQTTSGYMGNPVAATLGVDNLTANPALPPPPPPDISWTFSSINAPDSNSFLYRLSGFDPPQANLGVIGQINPTIPMIVGKRYAVTIQDPLLHPFEVIAKGNTENEDTPLLSQGPVVSPFENDPNVAWQDEAGTIIFTLTADLIDAMNNPQMNQSPGYRCQVHASSEHGNFSVGGPPIEERITPSSVMIDMEVVASGLTAPITMVPDPTGSDRLYIVDQSGLVRVIDQGQLLAEPFLDVTNLLVQPLGVIGTFDVNDYDERGFLGLAFHPDFNEPNRPGYRRFYAYTSEPVQGLADFTIDLPLDQVNHQSVVREWRLDSNTEQANPNSFRVIMRIDEPQFNHNAGHLDFGPDGYLYIALGDGGGANDTSPGHGAHGSGQNINTVHGSILRIDPIDPGLTPDSPDPTSANGAYRVPLDNPFVGVDGVDEIYAYGFRNPYRFSFDTHSGALIVADVGQNLVEEIDIVNKGHNYGWNLKEGTFKFDPNGVNIGLPLDDPNLTDPVAQYDHDDGISIIGGYMYYGIEAPELFGKYIFGDFSRSFRTPNGRLLMADLFTGRIQELLIGPLYEPLGLFVKGMGQDNQGRIYVLAGTALGPYGNTGMVMKIVSPNERFIAELFGASAGTDSAATGQAIFELSSDGNSIAYQLMVQDINNVTMAHIHISDQPGGNGSPAVWLYPAAPPAVLIPGKFSGILAEGSFTEADLIGPLAGMTISYLLTAIQENRAYVNVHTEQFPAGEIRGQLK
jgi:glucose/arabinose dehydrogenase